MGKFHFDGHFIGLMSVVEKHDDCSAQKHKDRKPDEVELNCHQGGSRDTGADTGDEPSGYQQRNRRACNAHDHMSGTGQSQAKDHGSTFLEFFRNKRNQNHAQYLDQGKTVDHGNQIFSVQIILKIIDKGGCTNRVGKPVKKVGSNDDDPRPVSLDCADTFFDGNRFLRLGVFLSQTGKCKQKQNDSDDGKDGNGTGEARTVVSSSENTDHWENEGNGQKVSDISACHTVGVQHDSLVCITA